MESRNGSESLTRMKCKRILNQKETEDVECYISEEHLNIEAQQPIRIPLLKIKGHRVEGAEFNNMVITYLDNLNQNQRLSLEMTNACPFDIQLTLAIQKANAQWLESLPVEQRYVGF